MHFKIKNLCKILNQYEKIIIYGTGNYANAIYPKLVEGGLKEKIVCFTQTGESHINFIDGIKVINFKELDYDKSECVVLVAVSESYTDEIKQILIEQKFINIIYLIDYTWDAKQSEQLLSKLTVFEEYCECIADWYVETQSVVVEKKMVIDTLLNRGKCADRKVDSNLVVMISGHWSPRTTKIIGALKRKKYDIVLLDYGPNANSWCYDELRKLNLNQYKCQCIEEMLYQALQYCPLVYFFEPRWGDCLWVEIMLRNKKYFGKVVLAIYDVLNDGYAGCNKSDLATEKYALEHADGIVWRWFSKDYLEKKGFNYQGKSIQFIDYCDHGEKNIIEYDAVSSVIKFCEIVGYGDEYIDKRTYKERYMDTARLDEILEKIGNREDCIFHLYAGVLNSKNVEICKQYENQYKNFKFFQGTEHSELLKRLNAYDYMCFLYTDGEEPIDDIPIGEYYGSMYRNSIRNTFFDCLYAGVPIITTYGEKLWEYLSDYDIVIKMKLSEIDIDYLKQNKKYYRTRAETAGQELDIDKHIHRLTDFFEEL